LNHPRTFVAAFLTLIFVATSAIAAINVIVDPFWHFDLVEIPGFNAQKTQFPTFARSAKVGIVCRRQPTTVMLGASRVEVGMDPTHPALRSVPGRTYNLAPAGSGLHELDLNNAESSTCFTSTQARAARSGFPYVQCQSRGGGVWYRGFSLR
jgi:hypothetical protein